MHLLKSRNKQGHDNKVMSHATYKRKTRLPSATKRYMDKILARTMAPTSAAKEMEKPKTSEYRYYKKLKLSNNQNIPCLWSSNSENEIQKRELHNHHSGICKEYGTIFHYKRQKLQELAEKALSLESGELVLYGSKPIAMLLQRLEIFSHGNVVLASQKKDIPTGIEKRPLQSKIQPETYSSLHTKGGFEKVCFPLDISSDAEELKYVSCANKFSGIKTLVFQDEGYLSIISPSKVNEVHQDGSDVYEWSHDGITDFDFGTDSISNGQQLAQGIDFSPERILDTRYLHYPYSLFCKSCPLDDDHKWTSKDFPPLLDLQSNRCYVFESLCMKMNNLGSICRDKIKYEPKNSSFMKDITMQLLDHEDAFKYHRQEFLPEMGMILWTSPKKSLDFDLLLDHEDKHKHYKKEFIPETGLILWDSPNKDVFFNLKCDKNEDFYLRASSQTFSPTISLRNNDKDTGPGPDLGFSFASIRPHYGTDNWGPKESLSYIFPGEMDLLEGERKLHGNTDDFPYMNMNKQYCFMQADAQKVPGFLNLPYNSGDMKMKLNWGLGNAFNIPDIDLVREKRWESSSVAIYPEKVERIQPWDSDCNSYGAEHVGLIPYSYFSFRSLWQTGGEDIQEFSDLNDTHCLATNNNLSLLSGQIDNVNGSAFGFNSFSLGNQRQSMSNMLTHSFIQFQDFFSSTENNENSLYRRNYRESDICADKMDAWTHNLEIVPYSPSGKQRQRERND